MEGRFRIEGKQPGEQQSAIEEKGNRETTFDSSGFEYDIGLSPLVIKALSEASVIYLIPQIQQVVIEATTKTDSVNTEMLKHAIDKAAELSGIIHDRNFIHVKELLAKDLIKHSKEINHYAACKIKVFKDLPATNPQMAPTLEEIKADNKFTLVKVHIPPSTERQFRYEPNTDSVNIRTLIPFLSERRFH